MSDFLTHECGIAAVRLRKPLSYYYDRYGSALWGFHKLLLLMEKQHNRGQDGAGIGCVKLDMPNGKGYMERRRSIKRNALNALYAKEERDLSKLVRDKRVDLDRPETVKEHYDFGGEILIGHLRYGTSGEFNEGSCHPYLRRSNWPTRTLMLMGNFNMTNAMELNRVLIERGQHPIFSTDTQTVLEELGYHLDEAHTDLYRRFRDDESIPGRDIPDHISAALDLPAIVSRSAANWDGGYAICGVVGNGDLFMIRDPNGIRPCFMLVNEEVIAFASERAPLLTAFEVDEQDVDTLAPGAIVTVKADGSMSVDCFAAAGNYRPCSFERIYFSRGNDPQIYRERKALGAALVPQILKSIGGALDRTVFSFIPNTAEIAYQGMMDGLRLHRRREVRDILVAAAAAGRITPELVDDLIMRNWPRGEKVANKDIKMRTFITQSKERDHMASLVYDITYGVISEDDNLVVLDDSIVRGTTLKRSILKILARTRPRKIVICSTAPQIRYPDCYGIDMSELGRFIAFQAAVNLIKRGNNAKLLEDVYQQCLAELAKPEGQRANAVNGIYAPFTDEDVSAEISRMVYPESSSWHGEVEVVFQTIPNLRESIAGEVGDWYFTGDYPTPGGISTVNMAYIRWYEGKDGRVYDLPL